MFQKTGFPTKIEYKNKNIKKSLYDKKNQEKKTSFFKASFSIFLAYYCTKIFRYFLK